MQEEQILIIDDSPIDARFAAKILTEAGYEITVIHDSEEGLETAQQLLPSLILLDVTMPKLDGYQVCRRLKADTSTRGICTVLYTIRDQFIDCLKGIEAGADDFIIKTLNAQDFLERVRKILHERNIIPAGPTDVLDLGLIQPLVERQSQQEVFQLLYRIFNGNVREAMSVLLGSHVTSVLMDQAIQKAASRYPKFRALDSSHIIGLMFDPQALEDVSSTDLLQWFLTFNDELYHLVTKITRTRLNGVKEARGITKAFHDMVREMHEAYERLEGETTRQPTLAPAGAERREELAGPVVAPAREPSTRPLSPDCTLDSTGHLVYCNEDLMEALGLAKEELLGQPVSRFLTEQSQRVLNRMMEQLAEGGAAQARLSFRAKGNRILLADTNLSALFDSEGRLAMSRCALHLIPQAQLVQLKEEEIELLKRTIQTLRDEQASLTSIISHDFRQPLHGILLLCQFLQEEFQGKLDEKAVEYVRSMERAGLRLKKMVEDLVHFARINHVDENIEEVNLRTLVAEVLEELSDTTAKRGARVKMMTDLPSVIGSRDQMAELFRHLISNAIKFNTDPQPLVEIGIAREDEEGHTFYVKDNGIGIEAEYHGPIFDLFHRLHTPEEYEGTGTGLAICRRIIEAHGGKIWVRSEPGAGAMFLFTIPRSSHAE